MLAKTKIMPVQVPGASNKVKMYRLIRWVFWAGLLILLIRGVVSIFDSNQVVQQKMETPPVVSSEAQSFAQAFAKAYYSIDPKKGDEYTQVLTPFIGKGLLSDMAGMDPSQASDKFSVISTLPWRVEQLTDNTANIKVRVEIQKEPNEGDPQTFVRYLLVPISYNGSGYYVHDFPTVVPEELPSIGEIATYPELPEASQGIAGQVQQTLNDFFRAYSQEPPSTLKFFMADGKDIRGYEKSMAFKEIAELRAYLPSGVSQTSVPDRVIAYVTSVWTDSAGMIQRQHFTLHMIFKEERWYVQTIKGGFHQ